MAEGKKGRKVGRNKKWCEAYRSRSQEQRNQAPKLAKHCLRFPADKAAIARLKVLLVLPGVKIPGPTREKLGL